DSGFARMFLTYDRVFPAGASEADLLSIYRPRPGLPFTNAMLETGEKRILWTTFTPQQIDIDVQHPKGKAYLRTILDRFQSAGIRMIRSEEHTSELQSHLNLVCRLLLEKKNIKQ